MASIKRACTVGENITDPGWTNPGNVTASDSTYASAGYVAYQMVARSFGFSIPTGSTIDGIEVHVTGYSTGGNAPRRRLSTFLTKDASTQDGSDHTIDFTTSNATYTIGSSTDLHGTTWTPAQINSANFGLIMNPNVQEVYDRFVDYVEITIHYTEVTSDLSINVNDPVTVTEDVEAELSVVPDAEISVNDEIGLDEDIDVDIYSLDELGAPQNVQAAGVSTSEIEVTWHSVSGAEGYEYRYRIKAL